GRAPRVRGRADRPRSLFAVGHHTAEGPAPVRPARHRQDEARQGARDGVGRGLLPPEADEPHLQVRREHGRAAPGDSEDRHGRGQGGALSRRSGGAVARAPPAAAAGARGERPPGRRALREARRDGLRDAHPGRRNGDPARRDRRLQGRARGRREDPLRSVSLDAGPADIAPVIASTKVRVRYKDTDCMQVVYYGNYLTYFEVGRVEFLRQQGLPMSDVDRKVHLPVVEAVVRYARPARLDDLLEIRCWVSEQRRASVRFAYEIVSEDGETV